MYYFVYPATLTPRIAKKLEAVFAAAVTLKRLEILGTGQWRETSSQHTGCSALYEKGNSQRFQSLPVRLRVLERIGDRKSLGDCRH